MWFQGVSGDLSQRFKHSWMEKQTNQSTKAVCGHGKVVIADTNSNHYCTVGGCRVLTAVIWHSHLASITPGLDHLGHYVYSSPWTSLRFRNGLANPRSCHAFFISALTTCPHQYPASDTQTLPTLTAVLAKIASHSQLLPAFPASAFSTTASAWGSRKEKPR